jgi:hypothetical protein
MLLNRMGALEFEFEFDESQTYFPTIMRFEGSAILSLIIVGMLETETVEINI